MMKPDRNAAATLVILHMLGPALVVLFTPFAGSRAVFLIAAALVLTLTLAAALTLRAPHRRGLVSQYSSTAALR